MTTTNNKPAQTFKKGDKVTYYGNPGEVKKAEFNTFSNDWTYDINYTDGGQRRGAQGLEARDLKKA